VAARAYRDAATRFALAVRGYADVGSRLRLAARGYGDVLSLFRLTALVARDAVARFGLAVRGYRDVAARFGLILFAAGTEWVGVSGRFILATETHYTREAYSGGGMVSGGAGRMFSSRKR